MCAVAYVAKRKEKEWIYGSATAGAVYRLKNRVVLYYSKTKGAVHAVEQMMREYS
jgi:hypothetical protein